MTKKEAIKQIDGVWRILDDRTGEYVGEFKSRKAARAARETTGVEAATAEPVASEPVIETVSEISEKTAADSACNAEAVGVSSEKSATVAATETKSETKEQKIMTLELKKLRTNKGNATLYGQEGLGASIRFPKTLFAAGVTPPETLTITVPDGIFAAPGTVAASRVTSAEKLEKMKALAEKQATRAKKAQERAEKTAKQVAAAQGVVAAPATEQAAV